MKILALETTKRIGDVALMDGRKVLLEMELNPEQRSAESLAPAIETALRQAAWRPSDVDLVATTVGPGSFTGLRVGVTTAKTFAYAASAHLLGVDTLEAIAAAVPLDVTAVWVAVDAQRGQVVTARFHRAPDGWMQPAGPAALVDVEAWLAGVAEGVPVTGPVLRKMAGQLPEGVVALAPQHWSPAAASVARIAARHYAEGRRDDLWKLVPRYFRPSAAEEKWKARGR